MSFFFIIASRPASQVFLVASAWRLLLVGARPQELEQLGDHASAIAAEIGATFRQNDRIRAASGVSSVQSNFVCCRKSFVYFQTIYLPLTKLNIQSFIY